MAKAEKAVEKSEVEVEIKPFSGAALQLGEVRGLRWRLDAPEGVEVEDLEDPRRWSVLASRLNPFDVIEVVGPVGCYWAELLVVDAQLGIRPVFKLLRTFALPIASSRDQRIVPAGHRIHFDPQNRTYTAIRDRDNVPLTMPQRTWNGAFTQLIAHASLSKTAA